MLSLKEMLEDETTTVRTVDGGEVEVAFDALLDALENRLEGIFEMADGFDADADEVVPPPDVARVSRRNTDPDYREARDRFNQLQAAERAADVRADGPVVPLPVQHRDEMSESERARAAVVGEINERYLGKDAGMYVVRMPFEDDGEGLATLLHFTLMHYSPGVILSETVSKDLKGIEHILQVVFDCLSEPMQHMVRDNVFVADNGLVPDPIVIGQMTTEDGEELNAWMVMFQLPERMVMIILQST